MTGCVVSSAIVFVRTKIGCGRLSRELEKAGISADAIHGDKGQRVVGAQVRGQSAAYVLEALGAYKKGETRGNQSALMWPQAQIMDQQTMDNVAAYIETL